MKDSLLIPQIPNGQGEMQQCVCGVVTNQVFYLLSNMFSAIEIWLFPSNVLIQHRKGLLKSPPQPTSRAIEHIPDKNSNFLLCDIRKTHVLMNPCVCVTPW